MIALVSALEARCLELLGQVWVRAEPSSSPSLSQQQVHELP